ncbi:MAG: ZrgA family zinc uptake protein, partial [Hyphomicrobiales bacterium]
NIAIEGNAVMMELEVPGADIVGFEHEAKSDEDKAKVADALKVLGAPGDLFMMPESAKCETKMADIEVEGEGDHNEFHGKYELSCANAGDIKGIKFGMFEKFPNLEELEVNVVTESGQSAHEVEKDSPQIELK